MQPEPALFAHRPAGALAWWAARALRRVWLLEALGLAAAIVLIVTVATALAQPRAYAQAGAGDALRSISGFWDVEENTQGSYRWSRQDAQLHLFGFEQRGPVLLTLQISAARPPGQPPALLTLQGTHDLPPFPVSTAVWRRYMVLLPPGPRGDEAPAIGLHSTTLALADDPRDLGVALDWFAARQYAPGLAAHLPNGRRLAFLVLLGLLGYAALRQNGHTARAALPAMLAAALALGATIAIVPGQIAYWLPNLWLLLALGWLALLLPRLLVPLRHASAGWPGIWIVGAICMMAIGQGLLLLQQPWAGGAGWGLLIGGCVALVAGLPALPLPEAAPLSRRAIGVGLLACTMLALALRLISLDSLPIGLWRDEARHGLLALRILHDPAFRPVYVPEVADLPALLFYLAAAPISLFGAHPWTIRLVPALAGALSPLVLYFAARPIAGARPALLAAGLLACAVWHLAVSRIGFPMTTGTLLALLAAGLTWRMLQPGATWVRYAQALLAGGALGLALYGYHTSRLAPLLVVVFAAGALGWDARAWWRGAARLALLGAVALLISLPLIRYGLTQTGQFNRRVLQTSLFNQATIAGRAPAMLVEQNLGIYLGMWNARGDANGRHNLPGAAMLDQLTALAFVAGAGLVLAGVRDRRALVLLAWLGVGLLPAMFSGGAPHTFRAIEALPPSLLLAGTGACVLASGLAVHVRRAGLARLVAVWLIGAVVLNIVRYFVIWPAAPGVYDQFYVADTHIGTLAQRLARAPIAIERGYQLFIPQTAPDDDVLEFLTTGAHVGTFDGARFSEPPGNHALLIVYGDHAAARLEQARLALGPDAVWLGTGPPTPRNGQPEYVIFGRGPEARRLVEAALGNSER